MMSLLEHLQFTARVNEGHRNWTFVPRISAPLKIAIADICTLLRILEFRVIGLMFRGAVAVIRVMLR